MGNRIIMIERCPCGSAAGAGYHQVDYEGGQVVCYSCSKRGPMKATPHEAIAAWNEEVRQAQSFRKDTLPGLRRRRRKVIRNASAAPYPQT